MKQWRTTGVFLLGIAAFILSNGKFLYGVAAWAFVPLLIWATKDWSYKKSLLWLALGLGLGNQLAFSGVVPETPVVFLKWMPALAGAHYALPFILQKWAFNKTKGFAATLVLPIFYTLLDQLNMQFNPSGTFGLLGYSQIGLAPVAQWAAVIGAIGLTFAVTWVGSVIAWKLVHGKAVSSRPLVAFCMVTLVAVTAGGVRYYSANSETVPAAGVHVLDREGETVLSLQSTERSEFKAASDRVVEDLYDATEALLQDGAKIVSHSEASAMIAVADKAAYLERFSELAAQYEAIIVTVPYVFDEVNQNVLYIINAEGTVLTEHFKYGGNLFEGSVKGDGLLEAVDTDYGKMAGVICWDKDFPLTMTQIGLAGTDLLFIPSADWYEIARYHTVVGQFRGIENGANVMTQAVNGLSMISDYTGRAYVEMNHYDNDVWTMAGEVPIQGVKTIYPTIAPYLGLLNLVGAVIIIVWVKRSKKRGAYETGVDLSQKR